MDGLTPELLAETVREVVRLYAELYTRPGEPPCFAIRARTGERPPFHSMWAEFGDWAPFLYRAGARDFVVGQLGLLARWVEAGGELLTPHAGWKRRVFPARSNAFHYTDLLVGVLDLAALEGDGRILNLARRLFGDVLERFDESGWLCQWRLPHLGVRIPVAETTSALFIELALDLAERTGEASYRDQAVAWGERFLELPFFARTGLFPEHVVVRPSLLGSAVRSEPSGARLAKHNLAVASALLGLARRAGEDGGRYREAIDRWHRGVQTHFLEPGGGAAASLRFGRDGAVAARCPPHIKNHGLVDLLCDLSFFLGEPAFLETARRVADFWLAQRSSSTGLLPFSPGGRVSYLDGETDWTVALLKLAELTEQETYRLAARELLAASLARHRTQVGFANGVDLVTGDLADDLVETRYGALLLKPVMLLAAGGRIYEGPEGGGWWKLLLDR